MAAKPIPPPEENSEDTTASNATAAPQQPVKNKDRADPDGQNPIKVGN